MLQCTSASTSQKISAGIPIASQLSLKQTKPLDCYTEPYHHALKMLKLEHTKPWSVLNSNMEQKPGIHTHPPQYKVLEQVQNFRLHVFVYRDYRRSTSASALVLSLHWDLLHTRRLLAQSTMLFKIHYSYVNISLPAIIIPASYLGRHDNNLKYAVPAATIDPYKFSFFPRTIRVWNQLPCAAVNATSVAAFH